MKKFQILVLSLTVSALLTNCTPDPLDEDIQEKKVEINLTSDDLQNIATLMTSYINEPAIRKEILSYATAETDNEVFRPFAAIIQDEENGRVASPFLKKLRETMSGIPCANCRTEDLSELEQLLMDKYAIYAPYLAENFADSDEPITITWWDGEDESGTTPGIMSSGAEGENDTKLIQVDDAFSATHPTLVLYPLEEDDLCGIMVRCGSTYDWGTGGDDDDDPAYPPRDIDCRDIDNSKTLELQMPQYKLHGNTRGWPRPNYLYFWSVVGEYSVNSDGTVLTSSETNEIWGSKGKHVSRDNAKNERWLNSDVQFIQKNWKQSQTNMQIVVAFKGGNKTFSDSGNAMIDTDGDFLSDKFASYTISKENAKGMFSVDFDKCGTLASIISDEGMGLKDGHRVGRFGSFSFYLKPVIEQ